MELKLTNGLSIRRMLLATACVAVAVAPIGISTTMIWLQVTFILVAMNVVLSYDDKFRFRVNVMCVGLIIILLFRVDFDSIRSRSVHRIYPTRDIGSLRRAIQRYYLAMQSYPPDLNALIVKPANLVNPDEWERTFDADAIPLDPWGTPYRYTVQGHEFEIRSAGADKQYDTIDDLFM